MKSHNLIPRSPAYFPPSCVVNPRWLGIVYTLILSCKHADVISTASNRYNDTMKLNLAALTTQYVSITKFVPMNMCGGAI